MLRGGWEEVLPVLRSCEARMGRGGSGNSLAASRAVEWYKTTVGTRRAGGSADVDGATALVGAKQERSSLRCERAGE